MVFGQDPARDVLIPRRTRIFGNKFCAGMAGAVSRAARRRACSSWIFHDSITQDLFVILLRCRQATRNPPAKLVIRPSLQACRIPLWLAGGSGCRVGVFPEAEEILVGSLCLGLISRQSERPAQLQARQCAYGIGENDARVVEDLRSEEH